MTSSCGAKTKRAENITVYVSSLEESFFLALSFLMFNFFFNTVFWLTLFFLMSSPTSADYNLHYVPLPWWLSWLRILLQCRRRGFNPWVERISWRREQLPTPGFSPGDFHGLYSPQGRKELDTTVPVSLSPSP